MPTTVDKNNPEWASQLAQQVEEAKESDIRTVSDAFAHLPLLVEAVGTTEAQVDGRFKLHALTGNAVNEPAEVFITLTEAGVSQDITLYQVGNRRLAGAMSLSAAPRERLHTIQANLAMLVSALEDALIAKAQRIVDGPA